MAQLERATSRRGKRYTASGIAKFDDIEAEYVKTTTLEADYLKADEITFSNISGGTATFGGTDNGDGVVEVKNAAGTNIVLINKDGITLSSGAQLIGGNGVLTNINAESTNMDWLYYDVFDKNNGLWFLGYNITSTSETEHEIWGNYLEFNVYIPTGFTVKAAYITLQHQSVYWNTPATWGYCRNIKAYKVSNDVTYVGADYNSEFQVEGTKTLTDITGAFGSSGFTAQTPSSSVIKELSTSIDIGTSITAGANNTIVIKSADTVPTATTDLGDSIDLIAPKTGMMIARLIVFGYTS